ncbi:MAG: nucleotidyltransferase family protein [Anaerolineae bacterium]|nr:nucleotidyltransferase family protein [Anaerolineae bacterium]
MREHQDILARRYGVAVVGVFGSYVRGEAQPESDLDLLVDFLRPVSLLELVGAELYLSEALGIKVDLVPRRSLRPELRNVILSQVVPV